MDSLKYVLAPLGRLLMSSLFIWAGIGKLMNPGGTAHATAASNPLPSIKLRCRGRTCFIVTTTRPEFCSRRAAARITVISVRWL